MIYKIKNIPHFLLLLLLAIGGGVTAGELVETKKKEELAKEKMQTPQKGADSENLPLAVAPEGWETSLKEALTKARVENKYVMANFTGSDWCGYCTLLKKEVFSKRTFKEWADKNVIKLHLDFPKNHRLPKNLAAQNHALLKRLGIKGFPTIIFLSPEGTPYTSLGYVPGGAKRWVNSAEMLLPKKLQLEPSLSKAYLKSQNTGAPLFIAASVREESSALVKGKVDEVLNTPTIMLNSGKNLIVAKINLKGLTADELGIWRLISAKVGAGAEYPVFLMLNSKQELLFSEAGGEVSALDIEKKVKKAMPKRAYNGEWLTTVSRAREIAQLYNRPLLYFFTGSDWCGYCDLLKKEVLNTPKFKKYAKKFVLVELDFPKIKKLPERLQFQNYNLQNAWGIEGFPTIVVVKSDGTPIGAVGYQEGGPEPFMEIIENTLK